MKQEEVLKKLKVPLLVKLLLQPRNQNKQKAKKKQRREMMMNF